METPTITLPVSALIFRPWEKNSSHKSLSLQTTLEPLPNTHRFLSEQHNLLVSTKYNLYPSTQMRPEYQLQVRQHFEQASRTHDAQHQHNMQLITNTDRHSAHMCTNKQPTTHLKSTRHSPYSLNKRRRALSDQAVNVLESWYYRNIHHPYPNDKDVTQLASQGHVSIVQVRKWMANKRVRSYNTLAFNGSVHPKRLQRLQRERLCVH